MTTRESFLRTQRGLTRAFIDNNPVTITLIPNAKVSDGAGGWTLAAGPPRAPQRFALIPMSGTTRGIILPIETTTGEQQRFEYVLLGEWDATIAKHDYWDDGDVRYTLDYLFPENGWERRAGVTRHGI